MDHLFKIVLFDDFSFNCDNIFKNLLDQEHHRYENDFINPARKQILELMSSFYGNIDEISNYLLSAGYDSNKVNYFVILLEKRKSEILYLTLIEQISKRGETVVTFDWIIKLICGTSDMKTLRYPLMQLTFATVLNECGQRERLFEVNKNVLAKFIQVLENIDECK